MKPKVRYRLYKTDEKVLEVIEMVRDFLFDIGIQTSQEEAWAIFEKMNHIPYEYLISKNKEIEYQGEGTYVSNKDYPDQVLTIQEVGRYELKATKNNRSKCYVPKIKFKPAKNIEEQIKSEIKVKGEFK
ncbi:MAG: hypothetical protein BWX57_00364 [Tenericutes bacterium ADurb.Bin024]|nr:MAG: hypothetical protein BWX57_00364 [Tenericutes bacterium ADurb.Bin024]HQQ39378.1 hypothetical protein [Bacilli bacterium]